MSVINTNIAAQTAANNLNKSSKLLNASLARLSSGSKIVNPSDDAAGTAEALRLSAQVNRVGAANANISNAISFSQTQDGFLQSIGSALDRLSTLAIQAQDVTKTGSDLANYNAEFTTLASYITSAAAKDFNGVSLFSGNSLSVTVDSDGGTYALTSVNLGASAYTTATLATVATSTAAASALTAVKAAITQLATDRASIGANVSRLTHTADQLSVLQTNLSAANSQISDVDVAQESTQYARYQILVQAGTSILAQANQQPQSALKLLGQ
jgi:flagellin